MNSSKPLNTTTSLLPHLAAGNILPVMCCRKRGRAVIDTPQARATSGAKAELVVLVFDLLHLLLFRAERELLCIWSQCWPACRSAERELPKKMFSRFSSLRGMSRLQMA